MEWVNKLLLIWEITLKEGKRTKEYTRLCYISKEPVEEYLRIPSHQECLDFKEKYIDLFKSFYDNNDQFIQKVYAKRLMEDI